MKAQVTTLYMLPVGANRVDILYVEYEGGGECFEFRAIHEVNELHISENGYGSPEAAAADGFKWLVDNVEVVKLVSQLRQTLSDPLASNVIQDDL